MQQQLIQRIVDEVRSKSTNNFLGRVFQLGPLAFALDIGIKGSYLYLGAEPSSPRFYLIQRRVKDLEKQSTSLSHFGQLVKAQLGGGRLVSCEKVANERIVRLTFQVEDELGIVYFRRLVAQLTGRAANLFILDELNRVCGALRAPKGPGQNRGEYYLPPPAQETHAREGPFAIRGSPSDFADDYFKNFDATRDFDQLVNNARSRLRKERSQINKLQANLQKDLADHGDPEAHKRIGDLLLANVSTAVREGSKARIRDFYSADTPKIEVEVDENTSLQEAAADRFRKYTKAKRAQEQISERLKSLDGEISALAQRERELAQILEGRDETALANFDKSTSTLQPGRGKAKHAVMIPGVRRYLSTDGYEILVGRAARDNDNLTFRIARPNDLWLHAGDYPGSHVVVRNPTRKEIPHRTIIEAAQLAGRFSQASDDAKVVVHYVERKFLSKPKRAEPGIVRMSRFRSITVEPKESVSRV